jgi:hypothetical protein
MQQQQIFTKVCVQVHANITFEACASPENTRQPCAHQQQSLFNSKQYLSKHDKLQVLLLLKHCVGLCQSTYHLELHSQGPSIPPHPIPKVTPLDVDVVTVGSWNVPCLHLKVVSAGAAALAATIVKDNSTSTGLDTSIHDRP